MEALHPLAEGPAMTGDPERLDPNLATPSPKGDLLWYDLAPLELEGQGWAQTEARFDRLPARAQGMVRPEVWELSRQSAGLLIRFRSDAVRLAARWTLRNPKLAMNHMPASGMSGLDLYVRHQDRMRWLGIVRPDQQSDEKEFCSGLTPELREFHLYLPLYNGVTELRLGLPPEAVLRRAAPRPESQRRPLAVYGTSIVQGGCAARPGMAYPAILGRRLERPVLNLGFSGNGRMEPELATLLAELDPAAYVLDHLPNLDDPRLVEERTTHCVNVLRAARPRTPIVLVESIELQQGYLVLERDRKVRLRCEALQRVYRQLKEAGLDNLHLQPGPPLLGSDGEATVDGVHPTDLGFLRMAQALEPLLRRILPGGEACRPSDGATGLI